MKLYLGVLLVGFFSAVAAKSLTEQLLEALQSRGQQETQVEQQKRSHESEGTLTSPELALAKQLLQKLSRKDIINDIPDRFDCRNIDSGAMVSAFREEIGNLECVYGYVLKDWIETFDIIRDNVDNKRSDEFIEMAGCLESILRSEMEAEVDSRADDWVIPRRCGMWTGRYEGSNMGHPYAGCDDVLSSQPDFDEVDDATLFNYVNADTACRLHRDLDLLEGIIAIVGEFGEIRNSPQGPPIELCVYNSIKRDAQWYRANNNLSGCSFRLESRDVNNVVDSLLKRWLGV